jgi:pimeloyl-ACP methyl ester carboxylesterase
MTPIDLHFEAHGDPSHEALVLLHGMTGTGADFGHLFDLAELARRYHVIVPDLRGHGRSRDPGGAAAFSQRACAHDVLALLDRLGIARFRAVGVSLGGNTLLHVATLAPARAQALVLAGSPSHFPAQARAILRGYRTAALAEPEQRRLHAVHGAAQVVALEQIIHGLAERDDDLAFTAADLATITARTLLVNGDSDPLYPVEVFVDMYRALPRAQLWIIPGGDHAPVFGTWREAFVRTALAFLEG